MQRARVYAKSDVCPLVYEPYGGAQELHIFGSYVTFTDKFTL